MMKHSFLMIALFIMLSLTGSYGQKNKKHAHKSAGDLVHTVFFKLKPEADKQILLKSFETFKNIEVIKDIQVGTFEDTGNPKSFLTDYTVIVKMTFSNIEGFRIYEKHPVHLASIEATKDLMAAPPIGYDYYVFANHAKGKHKGR